MKRVISVLLILFVGLCGVVAALYAERQGRKDGYRDGYREGFTDAEKFSELWWHTAESDVTQERENLWRSELRKEGWP